MRQTNSVQIPTPNPPIHKHEFTIPVEWKNTYLNDSEAKNQGLRIWDYASVFIKEVTKLSCSCGEEISR